MKFSHGYALGLTFGLWIGYLVGDTVWFYNWADVCGHSYEGWPCSGLYVHNLIDVVKLWLR